MLKIQILKILRVPSLDISEYAFNGLNKKKLMVVKGEYSLTFPQLKNGQVHGEMKVENEKKNGPKIWKKEQNFEGEKWKSSGRFLAARADRKG